MKRYEKLGQMLHQLRVKNSESITAIANAIGIDRSHLSKLENGHERPSIEVLNNLIRHYSLSRDEASHLSSLSGYRQGLVVEQQGGRGGITVNDNKNTPVTGENNPGVQINMPGNLATLYTDSVFVTTNDFGVVFDFSQSMGPTNQQNVIARLGMSKEHAKALLKVLIEKLGEEVRSKSLTKN
jgi:transcriptional regulator with XRE-family HTH domain